MRMLAASALARVQNLGRDVHFWLIVAMVLVGGFLHYTNPSACRSAGIAFDLTTYAMDPIIFVAPAVYAGFVFGPRGGLITLVGVTLVMLPEALLFSISRLDALLEVAGVVIVSGLVLLWLREQRLEKERRLDILARLEMARQELACQVGIIRRDEKRLAAIHEVCGVVSQSLDLPDIFERILDRVMVEMGAAAALVYLRDGEGDKLELVAQVGIPFQCARSSALFAVCEHLNGRVIASGEPLAVANALDDPDLVIASPRDAGAQSGAALPLLVVPLRAKGMLTGTLCVVGEGARGFSGDDLELLAAVGSQVGIGIENARLFHAALGSEEKYRDLFERVLTAQEEERQRIARELHDETAQSLLLILQRLDGLTYNKSRSLSDVTETQIEDLRDVALRTLGDLRRLTRDLRPQILDDLGFVAALEWLSEEMERQSGIKMRVTVTGTRRRLEPKRELLLFRIAQEALSNVRRHSGASAARVALEFLDGGVRIRVEDNGQGFQVPESVSQLASAGKLGLLGMFERARLAGGTIAIRAVPGSGTCVIAELSDK